MIAAPTHVEDPGQLCQMVVREQRDLKILPVAA
jgi:hypothetical protein